MLKLSGVDLTELGNWSTRENCHNITFTELLYFFGIGDCLITVATGPLSDSEADRAGLVPTHAYALLDIRKVQVSLCLHYSNGNRNQRGWKWELERKEMEIGMRMRIGNKGNRNRKERD